MNDYIDRKNVSLSLLVLLSFLCLPGRKKRRQTPANSNPEDSAEPSPVYVFNGEITTKSNDNTPFSQGLIRIFKPKIHFFPQI